VGGTAAAVTPSTVSGMSRNPILTDKAFAPESSGGATTTEAPPSPADEWNQAQTMQAAQAGSFTTGMAQQGPIAPATTGRTMTIGGTAAATFLFLMFVVAGGWVGWMQVTTTTGPGIDPQTGKQVVSATLNSPVALFVALFVALGLAILTSFKPKLARFTGAAYALTEGFVLGAISHLYDARFNGIVVQAILGVAGVFLAMLALYGLRILRVTPRMTKGIIAATFGVLFLYMIGWIMSLFGNTAIFTSSGPFGILISVVIVTIAAFNLLLDFDFIERGAKGGLPAYMDWYGAFGLTVTLVWIYLEMLRLLARLRSN